MYHLYTLNHDLSVQLKCSFIRKGGRVNNILNRIHDTLVFLKAHVVITINEAL